VCFRHLESNREGSEPKELSDKNRRPMNQRENLRKEAFKRFSPGAISIDSTWRRFFCADGNGPMWV
ncbi:hypothetical protein CEXT_547871, partial [Caerostris extrusa]